MSVREPDPSAKAADAPLPPAQRLEFEDAGPAMMLADHLDATLAMAEDLSRLALATTGDGGRSASVITLAQQARALELGIMARIVQARKRAQALDTEHADVQLLIRSFIGGTTVVADAVAADGQGFGDTGLYALASGAAALAFLKSRGIAAADVSVIDDIDLTMIGEDYYAAEIIHLGTLMDMLASFLDALDTAFELYSPANRPN